MAASWRDFPEEPPLEMHTRQRRRHFATPENLLTVITLLEYRAFAQRLIDREQTRDPLGVVQHPGGVHLWVVRPGQQCYLARVVEFVL